MATVVPIKEQSSLKIKYDLGLVNGKPKMKTKTYSSVKADATAQNVYDVAVAISSLQKHTVFETVKVDNTSLSE